MKGWYFYKFNIFCLIWIKLADAHLWMVFVTCTNFQTMPCSSKSFYNGDKIVSTNRQTDGQAFQIPPSNFDWGGGHNKICNRYKSSFLPHILIFIRFFVFFHFLNRKFNKHNNFYTDFNDSIYILKCAEIEVDNIK